MNVTAPVIGTLAEIQDFKKISDNLLQHSFNMSLHEQTHYYGAHGFMGDLVMEFDLKDEENEVGCNRKLLSPKVNVV